MFNVDFILKYKILIRREEHINKVKVFRYIKEIILNIITDIYLRVLRIDIIKNI